jgi:hypothetical protein
MTVQQRAAMQARPAQHSALTPQGCPTLAQHVPK